MRHPIHFLLPLCVLGLLLSACNKEKGFVTLPRGEQTISGVLKSTEISVVRRGTHLISDGGLDLFYAESSLVNLRDYQGKRVTLVGELEHNIDPKYLPVLVVTSVENVEETVKQRKFPSLDLVFEAPVEWDYTIGEDRISFTSGDDLVPILLVFQEKGEALPEGGTPLIIDAHRATRLTDEFSGSQIVSIKRDSVILSIVFSPRDRLDAELLRDQWNAVLSSVQLKTGSFPATLTGTGSLGTPCGGLAGVLCPAGYYCEVQDLKENIGHCKKI